MSKQENTPSDRFVQMLAAHQSHLRGYILASLGDYAHSEDVLQQTNLTLWKKVGDFRTDAPFLPWALAVARFEVLAFYRDRQRDHLVFQPDVAELMTEAALPEFEQVSERQFALRNCIKGLPKRQQKTLKLYYVANARMKEISQATGRSVDGVKSLLMRVRKALKKCIQTRLASQALDTGGVAHES